MLRFMFVTQINPSIKEFMNLILSRQQGEGFVLDRVLPMQSFGVSEGSSESA